MSVERRFLGTVAWSWLLGLSACSPDDDPVRTTDTEGTDTSTTNGDPTADVTTADVTTAGTTTTDATTTMQADSSTTASSSSGETSSETSTTAPVETSSSSSDGSSSGGSSSGGSESTSTGPDPVCGDGVVEGEEACDDAGESASCNADCTAAACGDGVVNVTAGETCDDAGRTALCDADCTSIECGDGIVNLSAGEACDDAGESATCNVSCTVAACGDGILNVAAGEACDAMGESAACNADCSLAACGDGIVNLTAGEACDDVVETAACNASCTVAECGDDLINVAAGEACDGVALGGATCQSEGFVYGTLSCTPGCQHDTSGCTDLPGVPVLTLGFSQVKQFDFSWAAAAGADYYQLEESTAPGEPFVQLGGDIFGTSVSHAMPLHFRHEASYRLRACNVEGCTDSATVDVVGSLAEAVGYVKASNTGEGDFFGYSVALSGDGNTLAVGAYNEDSGATGIDGNQADESAAEAGAVYVFARNAMGTWSQQAYVKASNTDPDDRFGYSLALDADGDTLVVGAYTESSNATGINGDQANDSMASAGAAYVFVRDGLGAWSQQAYVKASNTNSIDQFGYSVALSADGNTLAVGAYGEDSSATGIGGDQASNATSSSGAAYVFVRSGVGTWSQQAYVKASNPGAFDFFGRAVALSADGNTLAVGSLYEDSNATGIDGNQASNTAFNSGAVYVYVRNGVGAWSQQAYVKASNTGADDSFGWSVALAADGNTLAIGAQGEDSNATGIDGNQASNTGLTSGAVYVLVRSGAGVWSQQAYVKASNTGGEDLFGRTVALSGNGDTLAIGADFEDGNAVGIGGNQANNTASNAGAVYVLVRSGTVWSHAAYVKASNTASLDQLGWNLALSSDGETLAVGAYEEDGDGAGIGGDQASDASQGSGAVYLY